MARLFVLLENRTHMRMLVFDWGRRKSPTLTICVDITILQYCIAFIKLLPKKVRVNPGNGRRSNVLVLAGRTGLSQVSSGLRESLGEFRGLPVAGMRGPSQ
jgi:hypothetical protein